MAGEGLKNFNANSEYHWISIDQLDAIQSFITSVEKDGWMVGLASTVMTSNGISHLLMLDFSIPVSEESKEQLAWRLETFNKSGDVSYKLDGYLIQTGNSYHYLGKYIANESDFINFLGSSLLFRHADQNHFVVDDRWLGYTLKRNFGTIRIGKKNGEYPIIICEIA